MNSTFHNGRCVVILNNNRSPNDIYGRRNGDVFRDRGDNGGSDGGRGSEGGSDGGRDGAGDGDGYNRVFGSEDPQCPANMVDNCRPPYVRFSYFCKVS